MRAHPSRIGQVDPLPFFSIPDLAREKAARSIKAP
jgi:hypothetical protein